MTPMNHLPRWITDQDRIPLKGEVTCVKVIFNWLYNVSVLSDGQGLTGISFCQQLELVDVEAEKELTTNQNIHDE